MENDGFAFDHASIISTAIFDLRKDVLDFEILFDFLPKNIKKLKDYTKVKI